MPKGPRRSTEIRPDEPFSFQGPFEMFDEERGQLAEVDGCIAWARGFSPQTIDSNADAHALHTLANEVEKLRAEIAKLKQGGGV